MAAGTQTQPPAEVAAQITAAGMSLWFLDCILTVFLLLELAGLKLEEVYFQSLQHSLPISLQTYTNTHVCTHAHTLHSQSVLLFSF